MKLPTLLFFCLSLVWTSRLSGQSYPPSPVPDRILLTWSDNPATTQSVSWRTDTTVHEAWAEIAPADPSPEFSHYAYQAPAETRRVTTGREAGHFHSVTFTALDPESLYAYRVGDGSHWSEWQHFRTASRRPRPFSFLYFGDAQNLIKSMWSRVVREAYRSLPDVDFMLHAGDLVNDANDDEQWGEWFQAGGWIYGATPSIATPGNHEYFLDSTYQQHLSSYWRPMFTFPTHGPPGLKETVYFIDYQGARIISLNTQAMVSDPGSIALQREWLEEVLRDNPHPWTIITHHHPIYSTRFGRDNQEIREALQPLYETYGVDLVLQGHDHTYGRGHNLDLGNKRRNKGPVYVVSVSGPKMYRLGFGDWLERAASNTQLYQLIRVDGRRLYYEAYTVTGELYDAFELRKRRRGPNRFIDREPDDALENFTLPARAAGQMTEKEIEEYRRHFQEYVKRKQRE